MAKVEMSIQEYDQMRDKLHLYEEILSELLTPRQDKWDIQYFSDHPGSSMSLESKLVKDMPERVKEFLRDYIEHHVDKFIKDHGIGIGPEPIDDIMEYSKFTIGYLHHPEPVTAAEVVESGE